MHENDERYCIAIANSLVDNELKNEILLTKYVCGHYMFSDGQHRICAAGRLGIKLPVYYQESDYECVVCARKKRSLKFRILHIFNKSGYIEIFIS